MKPLGVGRRQHQQTCAVARWRTVSRIGPGSGVVAQGQQCHRLRFVRVRQPLHGFKVVVAAAVRRSQSAGKAFHIFTDVLCKRFFLKFVCDFPHAQGHLRHHEVVLNLSDDGLR